MVGRLDQDMHCVLPHAAVVLGLWQFGDVSAGIAKGDQWFAPLGTGIGFENWKYQPGFDTTQLHHYQRNRNRDSKQIGADSFRINGINNP
jgi:hypothetical protein